MNSPCVNKCSLDKETKICTGCLRTKDEITNWSKMSDANKWWVLEDIGFVRSLVYKFGLETDTKLI